MFSFVVIDDSLKILVEYHESVMIFGIYWGMELFVDSFGNHLSKLNSAVHNLTEVFIEVNIAENH